MGLSPVGNALYFLVVAGGILLVMGWHTRRITSRTRYYSYGAVLVIGAVLASVLKLTAG